MSQRTVTLVIDKLVRDRSLRHRFFDDPVETLAALCCLGIQLTPEEMDLFCRTDRGLWCWASSFMGSAVP